MVILCDVAEYTLRIRNENRKYISALGNRRVFTEIYATIPFQTPVGAKSKLLGAEDSPNSSTRDLGNGFRRDKSKSLHRMGLASSGRVSAWLVECRAKSSVQSFKKTKA